MGEVVEILEGHRRSVAGLHTPRRFPICLQRGVKTATANRLRGEKKGPFEGGKLIVTALKICTSCKAEEDGSC
ncbi:unnamed protein product [Prunus armeniaca]|uniref:Uncharacterized protein n=1 Tax=Prunus armeniaca TaxID=36596 RepID=A0A6J5VIH0_PRUAR|nr:unnamed protein product [Prunus armeniaca]